jgi:Flp pilus assembly pilin Flp
MPTPRQQKAPASRRSFLGTFAAIGLDQRSGQSADDAFPITVESEKMRTFIQRLRKDTRGANLVEYVLLVGLMAIICLAVFKLFGEKIKEKISGYSDTVDQIETSSQ